jgi:hypothetical protein
VISSRLEQLNLEKSPGAEERLAIDKDVWWYGISG